MGYAEKMHRLCALRGLDYSELARKVGLSKSSMSRILSGAQEPKLQVAERIARSLGVSLDYLVEESAEVESAGQFVRLSPDELAALRLIRRLGVDTALDRLLGIAGSPTTSRSGGVLGGDDGSPKPSAGIGASLERPAKV